MWMFHCRRPTKLRMFKCQAFHCERQRFRREFTCFFASYHSKWRTMQSKAVAKTLGWGMQVFCSFLVLIISGCLGCCCQLLTIAAVSFSNAFPYNFLNQSNEQLVHNIIARQWLIDWLKDQHCFFTEHFGKSTEFRITVYMAFDHDLRVPIHTFFKRDLRCQQL